MGHHARTAARKVSGSERQAKRPETGREVGFAEQSTGEGGEPRPTGPTGGKATPGLTLWWTESRERLCDHQPSQRHSNPWQSKRPTMPIVCVRRWPT